MFQKISENPFGSSEKLKQQRQISFFWFAFEILRNYLIRTYSFYRVTRKLFFSQMNQISFFFTEIDENIADFHYQFFSNSNNLLEYILQFTD